MPLAATFAKAAFQSFQGGTGKPHSSITEWVEILTGDGYREEDLDGIPELVEAINLQHEGPAEASRAIRKKLKHGNTQQKYRALVILKALVENGDKKFQTTFSDDRLIDAIRNLATDPSTDIRVKKKLMSVLASWHRQFKDDPSMKTIANLYKTCKSDSRVDSAVVQGLLLADPKDMERQKEERRRKRKEEEDARRREKEEAKRKERERRERANRPRRPPFNFEKEKPEILTSIANASQASNNLVNAIMLVNTQTEVLAENAHVQETLAKLKAARKPIVRYIQLVENEELIGTLLDTNERIISTLQIYDLACHPQEPEPAPSEPSTAPTEGPRGELNKLQHRQRLEIQRSASNRALNTMGGPGAMSDLAGLDFGGHESNARLPPPLRPTERDDDDDDANDRRATLSDYSDYDSDGDAPPRSDNSSVEAGPSTSARRHSLPAHGATKPYGDLLGREEEVEDEDPRYGKRGLPSDDDEDPFADPFADSHSAKR
ncbi:hypothetical protein EXIGLDRAFT_767437 [Exidia glandulosa HHB12029]|uniref:VHS domain-containing protein n=1 Tax=Exidia glandulosa HHB12029 TaxID=1314781 RepID=A0A165J0J2_EXIGL|nr:hypothetical protein EXIGLDRAFT_194806 [Exidia glandulosa HHB12029]KZV94146.1 hypothetical protein EXIGLDRAFT_767437 [Exidia glandulosa HHB12029]